MSRKKIGTGLMALCPECDHVQDGEYLRCTKCGHAILDKDLSKSIKVEELKQTKISKEDTEKYKQKIESAGGWMIGVGIFKIIAAIIFASGGLEEYSSFSGYDLGVPDLIVAVLIGLFMIFAGDQIAQLKPKAKTLIIIFLIVEVPLTLSTILLLGEKPWLMIFAIYFAFSALFYMKKLKANTIK